MLVLINDQIFDVADPAKSTEESSHLLSPTPAALISPRAAVEIGRELFFSAGGDRPLEKLLFALAALLCDKTDANAALFIAPQDAQSRADVMFRLADVELTTLAYLKQLQKGPSLPVELVNQSVWLQAA